MKEAYLLPERCPYQPEEGGQRVGEGGYLSLRRAVVTQYKNICRSVNFSPITTRDPTFLVTYPGPRTQLQLTLVFLRSVGPERTAAAPALRYAGGTPVSLAARRSAAATSVSNNAPPVVAAAAAPVAAETVFDAAEDAAAAAQHEEQEHDREDALVDPLEQKKIGERVPGVLVGFLKSQGAGGAPAEAPARTWVPRGGADVVFCSSLRADRSIRSCLVQ
eukprot:CAMPEP_0194271038 /NCGR_PEP_ID=MMETSP0169-20130528/4931_1 /TAXON_ID=218684 /ORGANISM="Corethron pennatum, Strain L29A3" /LENGTH=218 /DNA_ID=CAMNT_0039013303 /DNA_START=17 /DNA_END=674 /DNA_ORIENTATION=+